MFPPILSFQKTHQSPLTTTIITECFGGLTKVRNEWWQQYCGLFSLRASSCYWADLFEQARLGFLWVQIGFRKKRISGVGGGEIAIMHLEELLQNREQPYTDCVPSLIQNTKKNSHARKHTSASHAEQKVSPRTPKKVITTPIENSKYKIYQPLVCMHQYLKQKLPQFGYQREKCRNKQSRSHIRVCLLWCRLYINRKSLLIIDVGFAKHV